MKRGAFTEWQVASGVAGPGLKRTVQLDSALTSVGSASETREDLGKANNGALGSESLAARPLREI